MKHNEKYQEQLRTVSPEIRMEMELSRSIVDRIHQILKDKNMTQRELAARIGCSEAQIIRWTHGFPNFTLSAVARISAALGEPLITIPVTTFSSEKPPREG